MQLSLPVPSKDEHVYGKSLSFIKERMNYEEQTYGPCKNLGSQ